MSEETATADGRRNPDLDVEVDNKANWNRPERRRWGFHNLHRLARRSMTVRAAELRPLTRDIDRRIGDLPEVRRLTGTTAFSALAVVQGERVVHECWAPDFGPDCPHSIQSISKTTVHLLMGRLVEAGTVDLERPIGDYLPEVGSGYATATVQQALDMDVANNFREDYADPWEVPAGPTGEVGYGREEIAMGWRLPPPGEPWTGCRAFASALESTATANDTGLAQYKSPNTDICAWIVERASGRSLVDQIIEVVEAAGIEDCLHMSVDADGVPVVSGGISMTARDLARYGQLVLRGGAGVGGRRVGSPGFLEATRRRGVPMAPPYRDMRYSNQLMTNGRWVGHAGYGGQFLLADPETDTSVAFLSVLEDREGYDENYIPEIVVMAEAIVRLAGTGTP